MTTLKDEELARHFRAVSHPRRAMLFRLLAERPEAGQSFQHLQLTSRLCDSSLVHHLREMERCGLIYRRRQGPRVAYILNPERFVIALRDARRISDQVHSVARRAA